MESQKTQSIQNKPKENNAKTTTKQNRKEKTNYETFKT